MSVVQAAKALTNAVVDSMMENEGNVGEAESRINDASRKLIAAIEETHGEAWLGFMERQRKDLLMPSKEVMWKWGGDLVYNFGADFVVPRFDQELDNLIKERSDAPYEGVAKDKIWVDKIANRVAAINGHLLLWS